MSDRSYTETYENLAQDGFEIRIGGDANQLLPISFIEHIYGPIYRIHRSLSWMGYVIHTLQTLWSIPEALPQSFAIKIFPDLKRFLNERIVYRRLRPLQGRTIPRMFGDAICVSKNGEGFTALVMEYIDGLDIEKMSQSTLESLAPQILDRFRQLSPFGVQHADPASRNLIVTKEHRNNGARLGMFAILFLLIIYAIPLNARNELRIVST